jgi:hypothetical protein
MAYQSKILFFKLTQEDLLKILENSTSTQETFKVLTSLSIHKLNENAIFPLKNVVENSLTMKNRNLAFKLLQRNFPYIIDDIKIKDFNKVGYVYFIKETFSNHIKIGRSSNLEKRLRLFISDFPFEIQLIHYIKSNNYEKIELEFHKYFKENRANGEWFKIDDIELKKIISGEYPQTIKNLISY